MVEVGMQHCKGVFKSSGYVNRRALMHFTISAGRDKLFGLQKRSLNI